MFLRITSTALTFALCLANASAQSCGPAVIPIGQPGLIGFTPACLGAMPLPLPPGGNPGFAIFAGSLPMPLSFEFLVFSGFAPPPFAAIPPGMLCGAFGLPGTLPAAYIGAFYVGVSMPAPPPFALPVPPGFPPGALFLTVQTAGYNPVTGCIAISNGTTITN